MAEKPILFNTEMVKAILDGRKTQTRRVCKGQPQDGVTNPETMGYKPPYRSGDILWVRETWAKRWALNLDAGEFEFDSYIYRASYDVDPTSVKWYPSIHMPKDAARLFLRVKDVRMERLQDMSEEDAISEGYSGVCPGAHTVYFSDGYAEPCHVGGEDCRYGYWYCNHSIQEAFGSDIWDKTIKVAELQRYGWAANPWVWVIEFERLDGKPAGLWADRDTAQWADQDVLMPAT